MRLRYRTELNAYASTLVHVQASLQSRAVERTAVDHALYDVVDYGPNEARSTPEVMAYAVKYSHAIEIVDALNMVENLGAPSRHANLLVRE